LKRVRLRSRVLLLTAAFALTLFGITFGLSWRSLVAQSRWARLVGVETQAIGALDEVIRAQNAFHAQCTTPARVPAPHCVDRYASVVQLLDRETLRAIDTAALRRRMNRYADAPSTAGSAAITAEASRLIDERKSEIARQLPELHRGGRDMMSAALAIAWILVICSFAAVQITLRKVVRPLEELARSADRITDGDLNARAPVAGDHEIAHLGLAFNAMADKLREHARTDDLTGLPNFRAFRERIDNEIDRASRYPEHFGVLVLDLDRFKQYNDNFGHLAGNVALQRVSQVIRAAVRSVDFAARYGGEEFAVIVPNIEVATLTVIAERIRAGVEALPAPPDGAQVTVSIGAALFPPDGKTAEQLFHVADERLYQAKAEGRNRVVTPAPVRRSGDRQSA
jgi:diguanylate cyclase (GGDEF)-like protein